MAATNCVLRFVSFQTLRVCRNCRGLHDFLYSNEEDHGATSSDGSVEFFDGTSLYQARWPQAVVCNHIILYHKYRLRGDSLAIYIFLAPSTVNARGWHRRAMTRLYRFITSSPEYCSSHPRFMSSAGWRRGEAVNGNGLKVEGNYGSNRIVNTVCNGVARGS